MVLEGSAELGRLGTSTEQVDFVSIENDLVGRIMIRRDPRYPFPYHFVLLSASLLRHLRYP
jgi:hypothetical protein